MHKCLYSNAKEEQMVLPYNLGDHESIIILVIARKWSNNFASCKYHCPLLSQKQVWILFLPVFSFRLEARHNFLSTSNLSHLVLFSFIQQTVIRNNIKHDVLAIFPITMKKHNLQQAAAMVWSSGKKWRQESGISSHTAPRVRKQKEINTDAQLIFSLSPWDRCHNIYGLLSHLIEPILGLPHRHDQRSVA